MAKIFVFLFCLIIFSGNCYAQEVWVYHSSISGEKIYVLDDTVEYTPKTATLCSAKIKRVDRYGKASYEIWEYGGDEGYLFASDGKIRGYAIARCASYWGDGKVNYRPDLMAVYMWIMFTHSAKPLNDIYCYVAYK